MRIIHFSPYYPPDKVGGIGEFTARLHQGLLDAGHDSFVITRGTSPILHGQRIATSAFAWFFKTALWARRASTDYDIVHCQAGEALPLMILLKLRQCLVRRTDKKPRIVTTFHVNYAEMRKAARPYTLERQTFSTGLLAQFKILLSTAAHQTIDWMAACLSDEITAVAESTARDFRSPRRPVTVIHNGIAPVADSPASPIQPVELLYVGTAGHRKRTTSLPFVLRHVRESIPDARLRIIGFNLTDHPETRRTFETLGLMTAVEWIGAKRSDELPPYYSQACCLLLPSVYEGLPYVMLEAMQNGVPVVAVGSGGIPEAITDQQNGYLVAPDDPIAMAARCIELIQHPEKRTRISESARQTVNSRFTLSAQVQAYISAYAHALSGK